METVTGDPGTGEDGWRAIPADLGEDGGTILSERQLQLWTLVLQARTVPYRPVPCGTGWQLLVPLEAYPLALGELRQYEERNRNWPPPAPITPVQYNNILVTLSVLLLLATFHNITQLDASRFGYRYIDWYAIGSADAARMLDGEWWRAVTALTLHANLLHLFSNLTIGGFFIVCLCRELGSGLAWCLLLCSGILGNATNALVQQPDHISVGASTAVFAAVGGLAAISVVRYRQFPSKRWTLPAAAALALLGLLGTEGKQTDLGAHFFGFLFGIGFGLGSEFLIARHGRPGPLLNALLAMASACAVAGAWWVAVVSGG
jgi:membrane associated rhomboid family serine protease